MHQLTLSNGELRLFNMSLYKWCSPVPTRQQLFNSSVVDLSVCFTLLRQFVLLQSEFLCILDIALRGVVAWQQLLITTNTSMFKVRESLIPYCELDLQFFLKSFEVALTSQVRNLDNSAHAVSFLLFLSLCDHPLVSQHLTLTSGQSSSSKRRPQLATIHSCSGNDCRSSWITQLQKVFLLLSCCLMGQMVMSLLSGLFCNLLQYCSVMFVSIGYCIHHLFLCVFQL